LLNALQLADGELAVVAVCISRPEPTRLTSYALRPVVPVGSAARRQRDLQQPHVGLGLKTFQRLGREAGRHQHLDELLAHRLRAAPSSGRLKAMMPPKAEVGSVWKALA
jgi:hypothetical protein